ncbi:TspO/MBR-related protein [Aspergillus karnatakaensis]|uniref:TspO/MBR family protein n=1 Tax=Aspergillus karnatakaensis TaxID=1810916 RepID=UPI003CCE24D3
MPWSFALPHAIFESPLLSTLTPIATGSTIGYLVNRRGTKPTYRSLRQPPFSPPAWLFAPAWTLLYGLMGYAVHHATASTSSLTSLSDSGIGFTGLGRDLTRTQTLYTVQLALNHLWMPLFFGLGKPGLAAVDILLLGGTVGALMKEFWESDRLAFWFFVPYAGWLGFATYLNFGVGFLNGWRVKKDDRKGE